MYNAVEEGAKPENKTGRMEKNIGAMLAPVTGLISARGLVGASRRPGW